MKQHKTALLLTEEIYCDLYFLLRCDGFFINYLIRKKNLVIKQLKLLKTKLTE
jgi:hypothetical protein